jgi:hypothetical protein
VETCTGSSWETIRVEEVVEEEGGGGGGGEHLTGLNVEDKPPLNMKNQFSSNWGSKSSREYTIDNVHIGNQ